MNERSSARVWSVSPSCRGERGGGGVGGGLRRNPAKVLLSSSGWVYEWSAAETKWAALGTASRISDAEKKPAA